MQVCDIKKVICAINVYSTLRWSFPLVYCKRAWKGDKEMFLVMLCSHQRLEKWCTRLLMWQRRFRLTTVYGAIIVIKTIRLYDVERTQYSIRPKRPTRVLDANGISIASAVSAGLRLTRWQTDCQTNRPRYLVGNNRRSAQWRRQILLLSMATTCIGAVDSCKTRRVAVYLKTHCNIGLKRAFFIGVLDRWHNCLLIYWRTSFLVPAFDDT